MNRRNLLVATSLGVFLVILSLLFIDRPWMSDLREVPIYDEGGGGIANSLFTTYSITIILIALLLASAMIGGVYLAKMEAKR